MSTRTYNGYLIIGDISGYTSYVAATELEHSHAVLTELLELIVHRFRPMLTIVKLEGDAVFAHAPADQISRGESLLDLIESTYVAFRDRVNGIVLHTTCECNACKAIPTLDLKFIVHFGAYVIQNVSGITDLVGSDVNLVHRLTKNHVSEQTGWQAYALFTDKSLEKMGVPPDGMLAHAETYDHLGEIKTHNLDLRSRYDTLTKSRQIFITSDEADLNLTMNFAAPSPMVWEWITDPNKRTLYFTGTTWSAASRPRGRTGVGASNHCAHGKDAVSVETILDWRPFDYYTVKTEAKMGQESMMDTIESILLETSPNGMETQLYWHIKLKNRGLAARLMSKVMARQIKKGLKNMQAMIHIETQQREATIHEQVVVETQPNAVDTD